MWHWGREGGETARHSMIVNGIGAIATGVTVMVVLVAKFVEGAWITVLLIPIMIITMMAVKRHFKSVQRQIADSAPLTVDRICEPLIVLPVDRWSKIAE